jgi:hypothetical protein
MGLEYIRSYISWHGHFKTAFRFLYRFTNKIFALRIFHCLTIDSDKVHRKQIAVHNQFKFTLFEHTFLEKICEIDEYRLPLEILNNARINNDICTGFVSDGNLAAYNWFTKEKVDLLGGKLKVKFSNEYIYAHKGFTHPKYRGNRLHGAGLIETLKLLSRNNCKGIVGIVEANNFDSLKSAYRMGFEEFGKIFCIKFTKKISHFFFW